MTAEDLAHFRALLRAQAAPAPKAGLAQRVLRRVAGGGASPMLGVLELDTLAPPARPGPAPSHALFGRREPEPPPPEPALAPAPAAAEPCGPLLLTTFLAPLAPREEPGAALGRVSLRARADAHDAGPFSTPETPPAARDSGVTLAIGGWSVAPPPSAAVRRLARIAAVCEAERRGLDARLAAAAR